MAISELRLGPTTNEKGKELALRELEDKINEIIRLLNELFGE